MNERKGGILMPISSLPSQEGIGTMGREAYRFIDFLKRSGMKIWQVLPLVPTNYGDSPYQSCSSTALNYYFIDLEELAEEGYLTREEIAAADLKWCDRRVDYGRQFLRKVPLLRKAFSRFEGGAEFDAFVEEGKYSDFAIFMSLKERFGHRAWTDWDEEYRIYDEERVQKYVADHREEFLFWQFTQFLFIKQWKKLKAYAHENGVAIMGDIPLYLAYDSVEMWKYGDEIFQVDEHRIPSCVAGVPPDAFSDDGQLWGNPLYDWEKMKKDGYSWWNKRFEEAFEVFDILRIDHFRGFDRYYAVPVGDPDARNGHWKDGPKETLFAGKLDWNIVAEDLGVLDEGVIRLMKNVGYPGMKILEFAFDGNEDNEHKPSCYTKNFVCYTGTHDNMPLRQYVEDLSKKQYDTFLKDLRAECKLLHVRCCARTMENLCQSVVRLAFASLADNVIIPMWDLLAMGGEARINLPSTVSDKNWSWRFLAEEFDEETERRLLRLLRRTGRA
ncbi:MAG: 4-alpha-glucanotransferase [Christensenellaceae bacterium]